MIADGHFLDKIDMWIMLFNEVIPNTLHEGLRGASTGGVTFPISRKECVHDVHTWCAGGMYNTTNGGESRSIEIFVIRGIDEQLCCSRIGA